MPIPAARADQADPEGREAPDDAAVQEVAGCLGHLVRTLKTCRLYDESNPTSLRFREGLAEGLVALVARKGALPLDVGSHALTWIGQEVLPAHSRDDNLAGVLHRDGVRRLTLEPGLEAREVDALVDLILRVTGPSAGEDDLVTLLWDADLPHVTVATVPLDGDADEGAADGAEEAPVLAWPRQESGTRQPVGPAEGVAQVSRSDDWITDEAPAELEQAFDQLEDRALLEIARFQQEQETGDREAMVPAILRFLGDCLAGNPTPDDRGELAAFVPRVLREGLAQGDWAGAAAALRFARACDPEWSGETFTDELCGPHAITTRHAIAALDRQGPDGVDSFLALGREFGRPLAPWLLHVLAGSEKRRVRRPLARVIGELLEGHPEVVLPWLADQRWYVVRNAVHVLGWIGGSDVANHVRAAADHPDPRVRREVVAALGQADAGTARPLLFAMLETADAEVFGVILHRLSADDDEAVTEKLLAVLQDPALRRRSDAERRALFLALASRGERVLPALEAELFSGGMFSRRPEPDRPAIALCIARIGTPAAREILTRGLASKNGAIRKACRIAGASEESRDE